MSAPDLSTIFGDVDLGKRSLPAVGTPVAFRPSSPEHFRVEEIPAYAPSGEGGHTFLFVEKRDLSTYEAIGRVANALDINAKDAGCAGLKDRLAIARQWISLPGVDPEAAMGLELEGVRVLEAKRHQNKLRTGHLHGNRFIIRTSAGPHAAERLDEIVSTGMPNRYGGQRFVRNNLERARAWLEGGSPPRDRRDRRMVVSALQAQVFNRVLDERERREARQLEGDLLARGTPSGPIVGWKMRRPDPACAARELEDEVFDRENVSPERMKVFGRLAPGTRRALWVKVEDARLETTDTEATVSFTLPAGSYATILMELLGCG